MKDRDRRPLEGLMPRGLLAILLGFLASGTARAHDLQYQVQPGPPMVVHFFFSDDSKFSFENFEVRAPGDSGIFQRGRTDRLGRVVLAPDRPGTWQVRVHSEDGHGTEVGVNVGPDGALAAYSRSFFDRYSRTFTGAGFILGAFGLYNLFNALYRQRKKPS